MPVSNAIGLMPSSAQTLLSGNSTSGSMDDAAVSFQDSLNRPSRISTWQPSAAEARSIDSASKQERQEQARASQQWKEEGCCRYGQQIGERNGKISG